jgi:hypothetical protein
VWPDNRAPACWPPSPHAGCIPLVMRDGACVSVRACVCGGGHHRRGIIGQGGRVREEWADLFPLWEKVSKEAGGGWTYFCGTTPASRPPAPL